MVKIPPTGIALEDIERQAIVEALKMSNWVQKDAAELLSISPRVMNYKIKTLGIDYTRGGRRHRADRATETTIVTSDLMYSSSSRLWGALSGRRPAAASSSRACSAASC